jgi:hypothetical protein
MNQLQIISYRQVVKGRELLAERPYYECTIHLDQSMEQKKLWKVPSNLPLLHFNVIVQMEGLNFEVGFTESSSLSCKPLP